MMIDREHYFDNCRPMKEFYQLPIILTVLLHVGFLTHVSASGHHVVTKIDKYVIIASVKREPVV